MKKLLHKKGGVGSCPKLSTANIALIFRAVGSFGQLLRGAIEVQSTYYSGKSDAD
jgi:hypothetical protein